MNQMEQDYVKIFATNRKARHDYQIFTKYEAGIVLQGSEVKSIKAGDINLKDSYVEILFGELYLINVHVGPYKPATKYNHAPERKRKLLMHKKEISKLYGKLKEKGLSMVPLQVYSKNGKIKVEVATVRGKKSFDKRETIKQRDFDREKARDFKTR